MALLRVTKGAAAGAVHAVFSTRQHTVIGRDADADVPIDDGRASRRHAAITLAHGHWVLKDLQSRNGTGLDDRRIDQAILRDGGAISIGTTTLTFHAGETAPVPAGDLHGTIPIESLAEESGVFRIRARQPAMDREVRVDWLHPTRRLEEEGVKLLACAIADASKLRGPGFLTLLAGSAGQEGEVFTILKGAGFTTLAQKLPELLREPLATRVEVFRSLVDLVLERATWASLRFPIGFEHVEATGAAGALAIRLPALDLAAFVSNVKGGLEHLPQHADYLPPECQKAPRSEANGAAPLASAMYNLGAMGYHLLTGQKPMGEGEVRKVLEHHRTLRPAPPNLLAPELPDELSRLLERMLDKDPEQRPRGRQEVLAALVAPLAPPTTAAPPPPPDPGPPGRTPVRERTSARERTPVAGPTPARGVTPAPAAGTTAVLAAPETAAGTDEKPARVAPPSRRPRATAIDTPHGLLYLPVWIMVAIVLFFVARYLTRLLLGTLAP